MKRVGVKPQARRADAAHAGHAAVAIAPPSGMRDLLPAEAVARAFLRKRIAETVALYGYDPVVTPVFELADVIERGLDAVDRRDLLRFVEPDTGEVALLRPDITPQIARVVATTLKQQPPPYRLSYEGTVIRRRRGRARLQRQIYQTGGECIGPRGPAADVEVVEVAARAAEATGLRAYRIELAHVQIGRNALEAVPEAFREAVAEAIARKDGHDLDFVLDQAGVAKRSRATLRALVELWGELDVLQRARRVLTGEVEKAALAELSAVAERVASLGLAGRVGIDLGELRGQAYYTGVSFTLLAEGPGEPVGGGGRYDRLLERFDLALPATGFALDLDHLEWALRAAGRAPEVERPVRLAVHGSAASMAPVLAALRAAGMVAASLDEAPASEALAYATAWGYDSALHASPRGIRATRAADGAVRSFASLDASTLGALAAWVREARVNVGRE